MTGVFSTICFHHTLCICYFVGVDVGKGQDGEPLTSST